ncbi:hypothetical protein B0H16DRAFT_725395 [Mycena metata]|nr:hypothetical protein B0H16DRAFT_725395 [Mycena metata]
MLATGYSAHIAQPLLLRVVEGCEDTLEEVEACKILEEQVLFHRDVRSIDQYQTTTITAAGVHISESRKLKTSWSFAEEYGVRVRTQ